MKSQHTNSERRFYIYSFNGYQGWLDSAEDSQEGRNKSIRTLYSPLRHSAPSLWNDTQFQEAGCQQCTRGLARGTPPKLHPRALSSPHCTQRPHNHFQRQGHLKMENVFHHIIFVHPVDKNHIPFSTGLYKISCRWPLLNIFLRKESICPSQKKTYKRKSFWMMLSIFSKASTFNYVNNFKNIEPLGYFFTVYFKGREENLFNLKSKVTLSQDTKFYILDIMVSNSAGLYLQFYML